MGVIISHSCLNANVHIGNNSSDQDAVVELQDKKIKVKTFHGSFLPIINKTQLQWFNTKSPSQGLSFKRQKALQAVYLEKWSLGLGYKGREKKSGQRQENMEGITIIEMKNGVSTYW